MADHTLTPNQLIAAQLIATGHTHVETAEKVGVSETTIYNWCRGTNGVGAAMNTEICRLNDHYAAELAGSALRTIKRVMTTGADGDAVSASKAALGRVEAIERRKLARARLEAEAARAAGPAPVDGTGVVALPPVEAPPVPPLSEDSEVPRSPEDPR